MSRAVPLGLAAALLPLAIACKPADRRPISPSAEAIVSDNNRGVGLMGQYDFESARAIFASLASQSPQRLDVQLNLAIATLNRQREGDEVEASTLFERVLAADPQNVRAHYGYGLILLNGGRASDALTHFTFVAEHAPSDAYAAYYVGQCRLQQNDPGGALQWFQRAQTLEPRLRSAAYGAFQALQRLGRGDDAERQLAVFRALEANPQSEVVDFKYTRMGPLAEPVLIDVEPSRNTPKPSGPVFESTPVPLQAGESDMWRVAGGTPSASVTAADIDGDGLIDLFVAGVIDAQGRRLNAVLINRGDGGFVMQSDHPLAHVNDVTAALWGDYDNDGLVDVYLCRRGPNQLWRQTEKGRWADVTAAAHADGGGGTTVDGALVDADHDGDLDLLLIKSDRASELLNNNGDGTFRAIGRTIGLAADRRRSSGLLVADLDADRDADIIVFEADGRHQVLINDRGWRYRHDPALDRFAGTRLTAAIAGDLDADGQPEIYASVDEGIRRWSRRAAGTWEDVPIPGSALLASSTQLALADVDGDGRPDLIGTTKDGRLAVLAIAPDGRAAPLFTAPGPAIAGWAVAVLDPARGPSLVALPAAAGPPLLWRPGTGRFPFVSILPTGRDPGGRQIRSNASGIGTQVAARADSRWTVMSTYRQQSGPGQSLQPAALGTGGLPQIDFLSITWSDGVLQTELALRPGGVRTIVETERQLSSCPVLFAFDGHHFAFVTDLLGVGGMGTPIRPGVYDPPRPRERVLLPDGLPAPRNGRLSIKLAEPMEEATYVDTLRLLSYDVPPGFSLVLDERKAVSAPEATGAARFVAGERLPTRVLADDEDVTQAVAAADGIAASPGRVDPRFIGRTAERVVTMQFDAAVDTAAGEPLLVADGWIEYPYAQTLFAAWQARAEYRAPTIDARGADGVWRIVRREFGYPAGTTRQISVPLGRLPRGTREIRLHTTLEIYWDRLAIGYAAPVTPEAVPLTMTSARLVSAGFPREVRSDGALSYDYDRRSPVADLRHPKGRYTALGPVEDLLAAADGALAVFGPGEELQVEFAAPQAPPRPGWTRRFVLDARGWCKDMDLYTKDGDTVEPLPGARTAAAAHLQQRHTTRYESGR